MEGLHICTTCGHRHKLPEDAEAVRDKALEQGRLGGQVCLAPDCDGTCESTGGHDPHARA